MLYACVHARARDTARTQVRNDNSSRFGKLITLEYADTEGIESGTEGGALSANIVGGRVSCYLIEKVRVVHHAEGESGFHIFYQLLSGANPQLLKRLGLGAPAEHKYLRPVAATADQVHRGTRVASAAARESLLLRCHGAAAWHTT